MKRDWYVQRDENGRPDTIRSRCGLPIAWNTWESDDEEGDMTLMAAAPTLLEALEAAETALRWAAQEAQGRVKQEIVSGWIYHANQAKAAIAKAKGEA